jgi:hypothetical protein
MEDVPLILMLMRGAVVRGTRSSTSSPYPFSPWYGLGLLVINRIVCTPRSCDDAPPPDHTRHVPTVRRTAWLGA